MGVNSVTEAFDVDMKGDSVMATTLSAVSAVGSVADTAFSTVVAGGNLH